MAVFTKIRLGFGRFGLELAEKETSFWHNLTVSLLQYVDVLSIAFRRQLGRYPNGFADIWNVHHFTIEIVRTQLHSRMPSRPPPRSLLLPLATASSQPSTFTPSQRVPFLLEAQWNQTQQAYASNVA
ncbi:MAG: hypothetical protein ACKESB_03545 [Candidatus Hodgkinia cicadicola]